MKSKLIKIVLSLAVACMLPMASFAAGKDLLKANIPQIYGKSKGASEGSSELTIIHIQDAHGNVEAQENVQAMIKTLAEQGKVDAIMDEGGWDEYNLKAYQDPQFSAEDRQAFSDFFTKWGLMHGASRYNVLENASTPVIGSENKATYDQNIEAFISSQSNKKESQAMIEKIKAAMEAVKLKLYDEDTRKFLETLTDFQNDKISLTAYAKSLKDKAEQAGVQWNTFNNFNKVAESITLEDKIDFAKIDKERLDMVDELETKVEKTVSDEIVTKSLNYRLGRLSASDYYDFLLSKAESVKLDMTKYENVVQYASLVKLYAQINDDELFAETSRLEDAVKAKIFKNDAQVNFDKNLKNLEVLNKMVSLEMTRADLAFYNDNKPSAVQAIAFLKDQAKSLNLGLEVTDTLGKIDQNLTSNEKFYQIAMKRDEVMVEKTLAMMDERGFKTVVLVAGGFHTEGIIKALQAKTISHMIITPRITNPDAPNYWLQNMLGEKTEGTKILEDVSSNIKVQTAASPDKSKDQTVEVLSALKAYLAAQAQGLEEGNTFEAFQQKLNASFKTAGATTDLTQLSGAQKVNYDAIDAVLKANKLTLDGFYETNNSSLFFETTVAGQTVKAPSLRNGTAISLPSALLNLAPENATLLATLLAQSEAAEVKAGPNSVNLLTNIQQNSPFLHVLLEVLNVASVNNMNMDAAVALARKIFDTAGKLSVAELAKAGFPSIEAVQAIENDADRKLAVTAVENVLAGLGSLAIDPASAQLYAQANKAIREDANNLTVVAVNADEVIGLNYDETVGFLADVNKDKAMYGLNMGSLQGGEVFAVQASNNKKLNALVALTHLRNPQWISEIQRDDKGQFASSERVVTLTVAEATKAKLNELRAQGKVVFVVGETASDVQSYLDEMSKQYAGLHIAVQEMQDRNVKDMIGKSLASRILTYDIGRGVALAMLTSNDVLNKRTDAAVSRLQGLADASKKDSIKTAVEAFATGNQPLNYASLIQPITQLLDALAAANSAVAWNA